MSVNDIMASTKQACIQLDRNTADRLRYAVKVVQRAKPHKSDITAKERESLETLRKDDQIRNMPTD